MQQFRVRSGVGSRHGTGKRDRGLDGRNQSEASKTAVEAAQDAAGQAGGSGDDPAACAQRQFMELAAGLRQAQEPRESDRWDIGYQWISRFLANDLVCCNEVMEPFAREILARLAVGFARAKAQLDATMLRALREGDDGAELSPFVLHDLRRTATSLMARAGIEPHICDRCLNHVAGTIRGVARTYNSFQYLDERRLALEALGRFVGLLVRDRLPGHVAEARVQLWLDNERKRSRQEAAGNIVDLPLAARV
jgi:hypothetical protein